MKLYWAPRTCAIGIHVLLEEAGARYELEEVEMRGGANRQPPFTDINPKGMVPTLVRDDASVLTEYSAIALWLAGRFPDAGLLPDDLEGRARAFEVMDHVVGTIHTLGFKRFFRPERFDPAAREDRNAWEQARARGREIASRGFTLLGQAMGEQLYVAGGRFTIADSALFYVERWIELAEVPAPANILAHFERMKTRPSVQRAMAMWDEA
jgi:glutathione S-transferase